MLLRHGECPEWSGIVDHSQQETPPVARTACDPILADRLNELIAGVEAREGRTYTNKAIACRATLLGYPLSTAAVSHIRCGRIRNPSFRNVVGIALALNLDVHHFLCAHDGTSLADVAPATRHLKSPQSEALPPEIVRLNRLGQKMFYAVTHGVATELSRHPEYRLDGPANPV